MHFDNITELLAVGGRFGFRDAPTMSEGVRRCPETSGGCRSSGDFRRVSEDSRGFRGFLARLGMVRTFGMVRDSVGMSEGVRGFPRVSQVPEGVPIFSGLFRGFPRVSPEDSPEFPEFPEDSPRIPEGVGVSVRIKKILKS